MSLDQSAIPTFANHQTFHPRFGWIKKGYDAAVTDPGVFSRADAPVLLGVGKNMVEAIRFWATATRVVARVPNPDRPRMSIAVPTQLGKALLDDDTGLDPYLEDPSTLWVLHWQAVSATTLLPVWWSAFNDFTALEFTEDELLRFCVDEVGSTIWSQPNESSIQKDVDCLLRMYTKRDMRGRETLDDLLDSPFRELGLIQPAPAGRATYRFARGAKPGLASLAITYTCLDYLAATDPDSRTVCLTRLASDSGSPGRLEYGPEDHASPNFDVDIEDDWYEDEADPLMQDDRDAVAVDVEDKDFGQLSGEVQFATGLEKRADEFVGCLNGVLSVFPEYLSLGGSLKAGAEPPCLLWAGSLRKPEGDIDFTLGASNRARDIIFLTAMMSVLYRTAVDQIDFDRLWVELQGYTAASFVKAMVRAVNRLTRDEASVIGRILKARDEVVTSTAARAEAELRLGALWDRVTESVDVARP